MQGNGWTKIRKTDLKRWDLGRGACGPWLGKDCGQELVLEHGVYSLEIPEGCERLQGPGKDGAAQSNNPSRTQFILFMGLIHCGPRGQI